MKIKIRQIGNSRGIIIPNPYLSECDIAAEADVHLEGKKIIIQKIDAPRAGWFDNYCFEDGPTETEVQWEGLPVDEGTAEWEW